jgi:hypothetical protein
MQATRAIISLLLLVAATAPGCSRTSANQGNVCGRVMLDGKPVEQGTIAFMPIEDTKGAATGGSIENGRYEIVGLHGPAVGWNRVEVHARCKTGRMIPYGFGGSGKTIEEETEGIAVQFNSDSTLKAEIKHGDNTCDFDVASK